MLEGFEWERNQPLRTPVAYAAGAHYAYDLLSGEVGRKDSGEERLRFLAYERCGPNDLDDHIDDLSEAFFEMGAGKLFVIDSRNALRWARVRATEMPQVTWVLDTTVGKSLPVIASLRRDSDWASPVAVTYTYNITTNPQTISLTLPGNAKSFSPIVIMKGTYTNPSITNTSLLVPGLTTGYKIQSTKDGSSANHWLKYDAGEHTVEFSSDAGVNYITNYGDNVRQAGQVQLFALKPGLNSIDVTGSTSGTLVITTYSFWH
jgi:hypothetical protein